MTEIRVPTLGESVTEATIGKWFKKPGDAVAVDEPLVELETDKVTIEVPAPAAGVLADIAAKDGETVAVGALLGQIKDGAAAAPATRRRPAARQEDRHHGADQRRRTNSRSRARRTSRRPQPKAASADMPLAAVGAQAVGGKRRRCRQALPAPARTAASPRATCWPRSSAPPRRRRRSRSRRRGAGARAFAGRRCRARGARADDAAAPDHRAPPEGGAEHRRHADDLQRGRHERGDGSCATNTRTLFEKKHGVKLGFMGFFVRACVQALKDIPAVNAEIDGTDIIYKNYYHIGVAVGTEKGLVVPVVRDCRSASRSPRSRRRSPISAGARATASSRSRRCRAAPSPSPTAASTAR